MKFQNPQNGYTIETDPPWLWMFLFGPFYLLKHRAWAHALLSFIVAALTAGISWFFYPFFAANIIRDSYLRKGWIELDQWPKSKSFSGPKQYIPWWERYFRLRK
jgi:hypothetical protein